MANAPSLESVLASIRKELGTPPFRRADADTPQPPPLPDPAVTTASEKLSSEPSVAGPDPGGPLT